MKTIAEILSSPAFWGILVPALAGVVTFYQSKAAERESEWRKEKLKLYLAFIESLSGITDSEKSPEGEIKFAKACNDLHALSPNGVLIALHAYQETMSIRNTVSTPQDKQVALDNLVWKIRRDLKIIPAEKEPEFLMLLWTSGRKLQK